jgi:glutathione reductase (NADPH)
VTLSYRGEKLLRGFDDEIRDFITRETGRKVTLKLLSEPERLLRNNKELRLYLNTGDEIACDMVLSATGRKPLTDDLGLEHVKVELDQQGAICVDEHFQTSEPSIYAVGDSIDRVALTPVALAEAQIVARALFSSENRPMDYRNVPSTVFCHPNVGTVGLTEQEARDEGLEIDIYSARVKQLRHTLSGRKEQSLLKLIVNTANDRVLGVHMVGPEAGELIQGFAVALNCGATKADFDNTIGIHPTLAEEFVTMRTMRKAHDQQD